jgi:NAD(P)-dependent dehydrogenase (short-subunit alcohol dehydrogenase family)
MTMETIAIPGQSHFAGLAGKVAVVSGGASGIGAEIVTRLLRHAARVAIVDIDDASAASLQQSLASEGLAGGHYFHCDLTDVAAMAETCARIERELGPVQILVNNAANDVRHDLDSVDAAMFDALVAVNLRHQFFMARNLRKAMAAAGGGSIINVGSHAVYVGATAMPVYGTAKAGIFGLTRALARALGQDRIRVNHVVPGWVLTDKQRQLWWTPEAEERRRNGQCIPDELLAGDIAEMVLFLASDSARLCTNQSWFVDGGRN